MRNTIETQISSIKKELQRLRNSIQLSLRRERIALIDLTVVSISIVISAIPAMHDFWRSIISGIGTTAI